MIDFSVQLRRSPCVCLKVLSGFGCSDNVFWVSQVFCVPFSPCLLRHKSTCSGGTLGGDGAALNKSCTSPELFLGKI